MVEVVIEFYLFVFKVSYIGGNGFRSIEIKWSFCYCYYFFSGYECVVNGSDVVCIYIKNMVGGWIGRVFI